MSVASSSNRFLFKNAAGSTVFDSDRSTFTALGAPISGTLSYPAYNALTSAEQVVDEIVTLSSCPADATMLLGMVYRSTLGVVTSEPIGGDIFLGRYSVAMLKDSINPRYLTSLSGTSCPAGAHIVRFYPDGGSLKLHRRLFMPRSGHGSTLTGMPAVTVNYMAICGVI